MTKQRCENRQLTLSASGREEKPANGQKRTSANNRNTETGAHIPLPINFLPQREPCSLCVHLLELSGRSERTDHDVITIRITECEFAGAGIGVQMGFLFQSSDKGACPKQRLIEVIHTKEQE